MRYESRLKDKRFFQSLALLSHTPPRNKLLCPKNWGFRSQWNYVSSNEQLAPVTIENIKILGAVLELPATQLFSWYVPPKWPQKFWFFQLPWVPIIPLSLFPLSIECPNLLDMKNFPWQCVHQEVFCFNLGYH